MRTPMLHPCSRAGCRTLTLGELCLEHEPPVRKTFARGRPYPPHPRPRADLVGKAA